MKADNPKISSCTDESDRELLRRFKKGDERALAALLEAHRGYLWHWVRFVRKKASWANPNDLFQEAYIGFDKAAQKFNLSRKGNFHAWARKSCIGKMFDSREVQLVKGTPYKRHRRVIKVHDRLMKKLNRSPTLEELSDATKLTVEQVEAALEPIDPFTLSLDEAKGEMKFDDPYESQLISDAFKRVGSDYADVIILHRLHKQTYKQIAKTMGRSEDSVKKLHQRAQKKFKDIMYGEGDRKDGT